MKLFIFFCGFCKQSSTFYSFMVNKVICFWHFQHFDTIFNTRPDYKRITKKYLLWYLFNFLLLFHQKIHNVDFFYQWKSKWQLKIINLKPTWRDAVVNKGNIESQKYFKTLSVLIFVSLTYHSLKNICKYKTLFVKK